MKLTLHNIRSLKSAEMAIHPQLTLIMGRNQAGKTTLLNTVAALMLGERNLYGSTAKDATPVLRTGEEVASAKLGADNEAWSQTLLWPAYEAGSFGTPPTVNEVTLGRVDPAGDFDAKGWADFVRGISNAGGIKPKEIYDALAALDGPEDELNSLGPLLKQGWDVAAKHCEDKRLAARRLWEQTTHEKFGTGKSDGWMAPDLQALPDDFATDIDALNSELKSLEAELSRSLAMGEIGTANAEDLTTKIQALGAEANELTGPIDQAARLVAKLQAELSHYPQSDPLSCPHCGCDVELKGGTLSKYEPTTYVRGSEDHHQLIEQLDAAKRDADELSEAKGQLVADITANQSVLKSVSRAGDGGRAADVVRESIDVAQGQHRALTVTREATRTYSEWSFWNDAHALLCPTGLRMQATIAALKELNPRIAAIAADIFPGRKVWLDGGAGGVSLWFENWPYQTLTWDGDPNSYALRIKVLFQILEAQRLGSGSFVIIDRFDTLEKAHKNGVMNALIKADVPAIIGQMVNEKPAKDLLAEAGAGRTYFINDGHVESV